MLAKGGNCMKGKTIKKYAIKFLKNLVKLSPKRVVYISCNPETLANDLNVLTKSGYRVRKIQPVDMFPYTNHVESVVCLTRTFDN